MELATYHITLNIHGQGAQTALSLRRGDTARQLCLRLTCDGAPYPILPGCYALFTCKKPDGTVVVDDCRIYRDRIFYRITPQTVSAPGRVACQVKLYSPEGLLLSAPELELTVHETVLAPEDLTSRDELAALDRLVIQSEQALFDLKNARESGEFTGEKGEKGEKGDKGDQGDKGDKGDPGDPGDITQAADEAVNRLCAPFDREGLVVTCSPVPGQPLRPVSLLPDTGCSRSVLHRCGKNLLRLAGRTPVTYLNFADTSKRSFNGNKVFLGITSENHFLHDIITSYELTETGAVFSAKQYGYCIGYDLPVTPGQVYRASCAQKRTLGMSFYTADGTYIDATTDNPLYAVAPANAAWGVLLLLPAEPNTAITYSQVQVYVGQQPTFEDYRGDCYTVDFGKTVVGGSYDWHTGILTDGAGEVTQLTPQRIPGISGVNNLYSNTGSTRVSGRSDLVAELETLKQAILSMGGNV